MCLGMAGGYIEPKEEKKTSLLKRKTNNDRINEMSVEEKVAFLNEHRQYHCLHCSYHYVNGDCYDKDCKLGYKTWLESEAEK